MIDCSEPPIVDAHCHPFLPEKEMKPLEAYLNLSDLPLSREELTSTMLYYRVMRELGRFLGVDGEKRILAERAKRMRADPSSYIKALFDDADIQMLIADSGFPFKEFTGYEVDLSAFSEMVGRETREVFRIETTLYGLLREETPWGEAVEGIRTRIGEAVRSGAVSLKSIIAYRTGLEYREWDETTVRNSWAEMVDLVKGGMTPKEVLGQRNVRNKSIYDTLLMVGVEEAGRLGVPLQIHTGFGDTPSIDLRLANPIQLYDLLQDDRAKKAKLVLIHAGYPYVEETGFLANAYPNVYLDFSQMAPFASVGIKDKLSAIFEMAPTKKIMYGSDGFNVPEMHWIAAIQSRGALASVLDEFVERRDCTEEEASFIAGDVLGGNARRLYRV